MTPTEEIHQHSREFDHLKAQRRLTPDAALTLSLRAAELIIAHHQISGGKCLRPAVTLLCQLATNEEPEVVRAGIAGIFPALIERLNDSFDLAACGLYDQVLAQIIEFCRHLPEGKALDKGLCRFGLRNETEVLTRKSRISNLKSQIPNPASFPAVKKVLLLSRVTIGADVAITSAILAKLREVLPQTEFVFLGSRKLRELYGGDSRIRVREIAYERGGNLLSRLMSWLDVLDTVDEERRDLDKDEVWVIDPDSRLTQLGFLPLVEGDHNYFFFESRSYQPESSYALGQLAANWIREIVGNANPAFPFVALPAKHREFGKAIAASIRNPVVALSFGVGGNHRKRISDEFEAQLVQTLLADSRLILDKGATVEERDQINRITTTIRAQGKTVIEITEANQPQIAEQDLSEADVVTWDGSIGAFAGLIAASDKYIGYDSAGQHIAAALGVPTLTIFVNANSAAFANRWRPFGKGKIEVVKVEAAAANHSLTAVPNWTPK